MVVVVVVRVVVSGKVMSESGRRKEVEGGMWKGVVQK